MIQTQELLDFFQERYREERGTRRDIRPRDRLSDDLDIPSVFVTELLVELEDRYGLRLLHDPRVWKVATVGEFLDLVLVIEAEQQPAVPAEVPA